MKQSRGRHDLTCWMFASLLALGGAGMSSGCVSDGPRADPFSPGGLTNGDATAGGTSDGGTGGDETSGSGDPSGSGPGSETGDPDDSGASAHDMPCAVDDLLAAHCHECHGDSPKFGAPMPLTHREDFLVPALSDPTQTVAETTQSRLHDAANPMPPGGPLADQELQPLLDWIAADTPASDENCDGGGGGDDPGSGAGPDSLPCEPDTILLAHGDGPDDSYHVPVVDDLYMCYTFKSPFSAGDQAIATAPIIGDDRVLHHWILYRTNTPQVDGGAGPCNMPLDATFVNGWAPGGDNSIMPPDVGMELAQSSDEWLILQVHYNNIAGHTDAYDKSGVAICTADTPRPNTAGILWLGSVYIGIPPGAQGYEVTGTCGSADTAAWPDPVTVMSSSPHMHELGRAFRTEIIRGGQGPTEMLLDVPFSFENQSDYPHDPAVLIHPGDALRSTCTYDNPSGQTVYFGEGTSDEMCFNFVMAYPIDQIPDRFCGILF